MEEQLRQAALEGNTESLLRIHRQNPLLLDRATVMGCFDETPLHAAALLGHLDFASQILNLKPNLAESLDSGRLSPLHLASAKGHVEIVRALVSARPGMCLVSDRDGLNPVHVAARKGRVEVLRLLVRASPEAARARADQGGTVLHLCVKQCEMEGLKVSMEEIGDWGFVNAKDVYGCTILHLAVADKQLEAQRDGTWQKILNQGEWLSKKRDALMVVASLLASMAFQAGVNPPGGVWQDNSLPDSLGHPVPNAHRAGEAVVAYNYPETYKYYLRANTISFVASLSTILLLISGLPFKRRTFMSILMVIMWPSISSMAFTYSYSIVAVTPKKDRGPLRRTMYVAVPVWCGVMGLLLFGHTIRLVGRLLKGNKMSPVLEAANHAKESQDVQIQMS